MYAAKQIYAQSSSPSAAVALTSGQQQGWMEERKLTVHHYSLQLEPKAQHTQLNLILNHTGYTTQHMETSKSTLVVQEHVRMQYWEY